MHKGEFLLMFLMFFSLAGIMAWEWAERRKERQERKETVNSAFQVMQMGLSMLPIFQNLQRKNEETCSCPDEPELTDAMKHKLAENKLIERLSDEMLNASFIPTSSDHYLHISQIRKVTPEYNATTGDIEKIVIKTADTEYYVNHGAAKVFLRWWEKVCATHVRLFYRDLGPDPMGTAVAFTGIDEPASQA